jgi:hypothetical protein
MYWFDSILGWEAEDFEADQIPAEWRPISTPITEDQYRVNIRKNEATRNKKLTFYGKQSQWEQRVS